MVKLEYREDVGEQSNRSSFVQEGVVGHLKACKREEAGVTVPRREHKRNKRVYNKKLCCYYCELIFQHRIARHLTTVHSDEHEVADCLSKTDTEKRKGLEKLKNMGNFKYNVEILRKREGELIIGRRIGRHVSCDYLPCPFCYTFYIGKDLWQHRNSCQFAPTRRNQYKERGIL